MDDQIVIKVCGLTRPDDVAQVLALGVDYCGFITYSPSPRGISLELAQALSADVPVGRRVMVDVSPSLEKLKHGLAAGFDFFQIHVEASVDPALLREWSALVGPERLWLAPRLKPGEPFPESFLPYANTFLVDTYSSSQVGGTGKLGDWGSFARWQQQYADKHWVLAGGLSPENVSDAITQTGARHVDVNSGVECAPGVKEAAKVKALFRELRG